MDAPPVFHRLCVAEVKRETDRSVAVAFEVPSHLRSDFRYLPGQHITVRAEVDGEDVRRSYSLCADAATGQLRIGIKQLRGGRFSTYANTRLRAGDFLDVTPPVGDFTIDPDPASTRHYAAVAAGSGITPVLSLISTTLRAEPGCRWTLLLGNRSVASIMFLEELSALKDRYPERFHLIHVLSREQQASSLLSGRIDRSRLEAIFACLVIAESVDLWFLCGPYRMVTAVRETLEDRGVPAADIRDELFFAGPPPPMDGEVSQGEDTEGAVDLTFTLDGRTSTVRMTRESRVLDAALAIRRELPWSCRGGMCASCKAQVTEGEVSMEHNYALAAEDLEAGYVLTCQAVPLSERVTVDYGPAMSINTRHSRESVVRAAGKLFALRGYHGTSMKDLGDELGLLKSSIYSHVSSKEDLLLEVVRRAERLFNDSARQALETASGEAGRLRALIGGHLQVILDHRDEASTFLNEARALDERYRGAVVAARGRYERRFRQVIDRGVRGGEFDDRVDPATASIFILSILNAVGRWYRPDGRLGPEELAEEMWSFIRSGLARTEGEGLPEGTGQT